MSLLSTLFCVVVLLAISSIHAHVSSPSRHLTGITLDRVIDITKAPPTEAPTEAPTPKPKKTFFIDVDDVHGHVAPTPEAPVKKKKKRPDLHAWSKDNKDKSGMIDPKIINQFIADAATPDELVDGQPPVKIVKLKDTKGRKRALPTEPPTDPPTPPIKSRAAEPLAESSTESQEEAAHEEEVEEESRLKRMRKTNRVKGQESVRDYEREHQHQDEKPRHEEEIMSNEDHRDTERDQHKATHDTERHDDTHEEDTHRHSHDDTHDTPNHSSDTEVHSAIPFEPVDEHMKEKLHWIDKEKKKETKIQWTWEKEKKDENKKPKDDINQHDETQTSTSKKRTEDTDDHSHDHISRRSRRDDTHDEPSREGREIDIKTREDTPQKTRREDDHDTPKSKATWEWKDEQNPIKTESDKKTSASKSKSTPVSKTGHDAVDRLVANMAADFAAHLEAEKAAGHDVTHLTVGDINNNRISSKSDKPYVPPIHHDNLAHHDYIDPDKVQFADSIVKWHAPAAPPAIKVVDETAIEREADGTVHLRGAQPPAEGGPAGIDLALP